MLHFATASSRREMLSIGFDKLTYFPGVRRAVLNMDVSVLIILSFKLKNHTFALNPRFCPSGPSGGRSEESASHHIWVVLMLNVSRRVLDDLWMII